MIGETDAAFAFDVIVVRVLDDLQYMTKMNRINLKPYLNYLSNYIKSFDSEKLQNFKERLMTYVLRFGWCYVEGVNPQGIILFEFMRNHLKYLDEFMEQIKTHKNLSFIENCALWGWTDILEFILNKGDIEVDVVGKLQLKSIDNINTQIETILNSIPESVVVDNIQIEILPYFTPIKITRGFTNN